MAAGDATFATATAVLDGLVDLDLDSLSGDGLSAAVLEMQRLRAKLECAEARLLSRWDAERCWQIDGAKTGAAWLAWKQRLPITETRRRIRHARALRTLPDIAAAWAAGEIDRTHLITLLGVRTPRTKTVFDSDHADLLDAARNYGFAEFQRRCDLWEMTVDPDGAEQGAEGERAAREVHLNQSFRGMFFGRMTFDRISGMIVSNTLKAIEQELFDKDWAAAKARLGREPLVMDLARTPAQRRADTMVEMAIRAATAPADGRRPAPLFTVVVGYETFVGPMLELFNRTVITPGTAVAHLLEADIERVVYDGPSRVIDVGTQTRFYRGALRRAIEVRDRTCFHPSCDEVPDRPQVDHIHEASKGGETTQTNGRLACGFHNRLRNRHPGHAGDRASPHPDDPHAGPDPPDET